MTQTRSQSELAKQSSMQQPVNTQNSFPVTDSTQKCDILLNNFQIKKRRYRVLFNYDHIVWERLDAKKNNDKDSTENLYKIKQGATFNKEQLPYNKRNYNVVHMNEIIRVAKGNTKSATFRNIPPQYSDLSLPAANLSNTQSTSQPSEQYLTIHYAFRLVKSEKDCNRWFVSSLTIFNSDTYIIRQWFDLLTRKLRNCTNRVHIRRLLVFINPYGGRKKALQVYERYCKPLFQLAGIDPSCMISQRANQINDILMAHDLSPYDAVCCVGGDGTAAEVVNGLIFRRIRDLGLDSRRPAYIPKPSLPIGIIPAGSTDTIAYSLHGTADVRTAAIHLILGQRRGLDISSVSNQNGLIRFCGSVLSYGYLGDVAAKSENYRWMGTKRYEFTGIKAFLANKGYEAEIEILLPDADEQQNNNTFPDEQSLETVHTTVDDNSVIGDGNLLLDSKCYADCKRCSSAPSLFGDRQTNFSGATENDINFDNDLPSSSNLTLFYSQSIDEQNCDAESKRISNHENVGYESVEVDDEEKDMKNCDMKISASERSLNDCSSSTTFTQMCTDTVIGGQPDSSQLEKSGVSINSISKDESKLPGPKMGFLKVIKGKFFMICGANITCACTRSPNGISRWSHLGDGFLDLVLVRKTSRFNNIRFVINTMSHAGDIRKLPFVEIYRTRQFRFRCNQRNVVVEHLSGRDSCQPIAESYQGAMVKDNNVSSWNCDGEVVHDLDITMSSHCQLVDVFMRGPFAFNKTTDQERSSRFCCCGSRSN